MRSNLQRLLDDYTAARIERHEVLEATARKERRMLRSFVEVFGNRPVGNMSRTDVERWLGTLHRLAPATRRLHYSALRQFVRWLRLNRHMRADPLLEVKPPRVPRSIPRALNPDEVAALHAVLPDLRAEVIFALMHSLGMRRCEVVTVEVGDWDMHARTIHIRYGKGGHERMVPTTQHVDRLLRRYTAGMGAGPLIRNNDRTRGVTSGYVGILMQRWMQTAGIKAAPFDGKACHSLRHTAASNLVDAEPDLRVAQQFLGHAGLSSTQVYLRRVGLDRMRAAMERSGPAA